MSLLARHYRPRSSWLTSQSIPKGILKSMAFFRYEDRPGVVHRLSGVLSDNDINIAFMQVGRTDAGGEAIMALAVDSPIAPDVLQAMVKAADITSGRFVNLDAD